MYNPRKSPASGLVLSYDFFTLQLGVLYLLYVDPNTLAF